MRNLILVLILSFLFTPFANARPMNAKEKAFVDFMIPKIEKANHHILQQRQHLLTLHKRYLKRNSLTQSEKLWLKKLSNQYGLKHADFSKEKTWQQMSSRVDIIPVSLVLAQAINESAWGRSRFALQGNNYFGQWCSAPGCGLVPKKRKPGSPWQVQKFASAYDSIVSYLNNVNSNHAYHKLRSIRYELRETGQPLSPNIIAEGLGNYSQRGDQYIVIMQNIINHFQLASFVQNYNLKA